MNLVMLSGRLGDDPKTRTAGEATVTSVSLATDESYVKKNGERVADTEWHDLEIWGRPGEILAQYTKKGSKLLITGKIKTNKWQNDEGETKTRKIIRVMSFEFLDNAPKADSPDTKEPENANTYGSNGENDLPF